jgi:subtilisin family serine protease
VLAVKQENYVSKEGNSMSTKGNLKLSLFVALILVAMLLGSVAATASAQAPARVKVLIAFTHQPGPAEQALVRSVGGDIKYTYHLVPAIAATVPEVALDGLQRNPKVSAVELDIEAQVIDAELDNAWGVKRIGAGLIHAQGKKGAGVTVGILDSGIDTDHPDLNYDPTCSYSFVAGETLEDGHSHGTHVAGTVAALDNDTGVVGAAPEATLCIYKVFDSSGNGNYSDIIAAVQQAVEDGVQVTNNSYGSSGDPGATVKAAFDNAYAAGVLQVGAAGNYGNIFGTGENCIYPARWDSVIAVAAITQSDTRAFFSSTCPEVELAAPGDPIYSTMPGGDYGYKNGTSMASPHLAGTAALVLAAYPGWSNADVRTQLQNTADELGEPGRDPWYGFGLVDADEAANHPPAAEDQAVTTDEDTSVGIILTASDPDGDPLTYSVVDGPANGTLSGSAPNLTYTPDPDFNGSDSFTFKANDGLADSNVATVSISVTPVNDPPLADDQPVTTAEDTAVSITLTGSDPDGDPAEPDLHPQPELQRFGQLHLPGQ